MPPPLEEEFLKHSAINRGGVKFLYFTLKHKIHIYLVRFGKCEERPCLIGRIEDVRVIYESSTLDENIELLNHQATVEETAARWFFFVPSATP